ncbi:nucleotidyltransferase family protein [Geminocystis sp. CENA526]|uniref:nucleotidyltransferase family protein n=1 Tax=Geminocystis sp. CENA526 TaxID=1355871 RepID=UPI003D6E7144
MMNQSQVIIDKQEGIKAIALKYKAENIRIFGSVAKKNFHSDSDIDFLVELPDECSLLELIEFKQSLEDLLGYSVDIVEENCLHSMIKKEILESAVRL